MSCGGDGSYFAILIIMKDEQCKPKSLRSHSVLKQIIKLRTLTRLIRPNGFFHISRSYKDNLYSDLDLG